MDRLAVNPAPAPSFEGRFVDRIGNERPCVVSGTSPDDLTVVGVGLTTGEAVLAFRVEALGLMHGLVEEGPADTFHLRIEEGAARRARLAARLAWHRDRLSGGVDHRTSPRVVPHRTAVFVRWAGIRVVGTLRDVSTGGAALDIEPLPEIGTPVVVGMRRAVVVRHTGSGIGVRFALPLRPEAVTADVTL